MQRHSDAVVVKDAAGILRAVSAASVRVNLADTSTAATIYSDNGTTAVANPLTTDSSGRFTFFAADGLYDLVVSGTGFTTYTVEDVELTEELGRITAVPSGTTSASVAITDFPSTVVSTPGVGGSMLIEYLIAGVWLAWPSGTVTAKTANYALATIEAARGTATTANGTFKVIP